MTQENLPQKILVVDNDMGILNAVTNGLIPYKINVIIAKDWESALYQFNTNKTDLCLISLELENLPGTALVQKWRNHENETKRSFACILSSSQQTTAMDHALLKELGDISVIQKPIQIPKLLSLMAQAMNLKNRRQQLIKIRSQLIDPLLQQERYEEAARMAGQKLEPLGDRGVFASSQIHIDAGKYERAKTLLKQLSQQDSGNISYHNELGRLYLMSGQLKEAQASYEAADKVAPGHLQRIRDMAHMYLQLNKPEESVKKFGDLIRLNPEQPDIKFDIYQDIMDAGFTQHAQDFCKQTSTPKELIRHFNNKGVMYSRQEEYNNAIDEYQKAARLIPGHKEIYRILYNMALAHINLKHPEHLKQAHLLLEQCLELKPDFEKAKEKMAITSKYIKDKKGDHQ